MTTEEIKGIQNAIESAGLKSKKFPKKIEINIPKAKFPGIYLSIPLNVKSFKLQVYCHQSSFAFVEKLNTKGYKIENVDLDKAFAIKEVKGIPTQEEIESYLNEALVEVINIGIVRPVVEAVA